MNELFLSKVRNCYFNNDDENQLLNDNEQYRELKSNQSLTFFARLPRQAYTDDFHVSLSIKTSEDVQGTRALDLRWSTFKKNVVLRLTLDLAKQKPSARSIPIIDMREVVIEGDLLIALSGDMHRRPLRIDGAKIKGDVVFTSPEGVSRLNISMVAAEIGGDIFIGRHPASGSTGAGSLRSAEKEAHRFYLHASHDHESDFDLSGSKIGGSLECAITKKEETEEQKCVLNLESAQVGKDVLIGSAEIDDHLNKIKRFEMNACHLMNLAFTKIGGSLAVQFTKVDELDCYQLSATDVQLGPELSVGFSKRTTDENVASFRKAQVLKSLSVVSSDLRNLDLGLANIQTVRICDGRDVDPSMPEELLKPNMFTNITGEGLVADKFLFEGASHVVNAMELRFSEIGETRIKPEVEEQDPPIKLIDLSDARHMGEVVIDSHVLGGPALEPLLRPVVSKGRKRFGAAFAFLAITPFLFVGACSIVEDRTVFELPGYVPIVFLGLLIVVAWPAFLVSKSFFSPPPKPDEKNAPDSLRDEWQRIWGEGCAADLWRVFMPSYKLIQDRNSSSLNLSHARIDELGFTHGFPNGLILDGSNVQAWRVGEKKEEPAFPESILEHAKEYRAENYVAFEQSMRSQGKNEEADRLFRTHKAYERKLATKPSRIVLSLLHSIIGYGTRRMRLFGFLVVWMFLTTCWFAIGYDKLFRIGTADWANIAQVVSVESGGANTYPWKADETQINGRIKAMRISSANDSWPKRSTTAFFLALRYHIPIVGVDLAPHLQPSDPDVSAYVKFVTLVNLILWPLFIASALPSILPRSDKG